MGNELIFRSQYISPIWHVAVDLEGRNVHAMDRKPVPAPRTVNVRIVENEKNVFDEVNASRTFAGSDLQRWGNSIVFAMKQRCRARKGWRKSAVISQRI